MIVFCVLLYIPIYNMTFQDIAIDGWPSHQSRDIKTYIQPNNVTTMHEPKHICSPHTRNKKNNLFLLIIVCSSTRNFNRRETIRETWGHYKTYLQLSKIYSKTREKYKDYNYTYELSNPLDGPVNVYNDWLKKTKRNIRCFKQLLLKLAKALTDDLDDNTNEDQVNLHMEKREVFIPEIDISKDLGKYNDDVGYVKKNRDQYFAGNSNFNEVLNIVRKNEYELEKDNIIIDNIVSIEEESDFKLLFLLGLPKTNDDSEIQNKIEEEVQKYGDILQQGFIDSYYNLTLKSTMMLKWVSNKCDESVRYILKTDDDMYINVPALITNLRSRSLIHDLNHPRSKEYLLIGHLMCGVKPYSDEYSKWYCPRYMFSEREYPHFLSGTAYTLSSPTAAALYRAALHQDFFHLEDVFITGICALRASLRPRHDAMFTHDKLPRPACAAHAHYSTHRLSPAALARVLATLLDPDKVDQCERERIMQQTQTVAREVNQNDHYQPEHLPVEFYRKDERAETYFT